MSDKQRKEIDKALKAMKESGADDKTARKVMEVWQSSDVSSSKDLRNQLVKGGLSLLLLAALQLGVDIIAAESAGAASFYAAISTYWAHGAVATLFSFLRYYFLISVAFDFFRLGSIIGMTIMLGTSANTTYKAIEELAGEKTGFSIVDKAQAAISTTKVLQALNSVRTAITGDMASSPAASGTLGDLNAYFVLSHAEKEYGSEAIQKHGLSQDNINKAAKMFGNFDANQDFRLEFSEFKKVCGTVDFDLSDEEIKAAMNILDKRGSGFIEFDEFLAWWADNVDTSAAEKASASEDAKKAEDALAEKKAGDTVDVPTPSKAS